MWTEALADVSGATGRGDGGGGVTVMTAAGGGAKSPDTEGRGEQLTAA